MSKQKISKADAAFVFMGAAGVVDDDGSVTAVSTGKKIVLEPTYTFIYNVYVCSKTIFSPVAVRYNKLTICNYQLDAVFKIIFLM